MQEILNGIEQGLREMRLSFAPEVKKYIDELNSYLKLLDQVTVKVFEISSLHKKEVVDVLAEKVTSENALSNIKADHALEVHDHDLKIKSKIEHQTRLDEDTAHKEKKVTDLDRSIQNLLIEHRNTETQANTYRGQVPSLERSIRSLKDEETKLIQSITSMKEEESKLITSIEGNKKTLGTILSDISINEARLK